MKYTKPNRKIYNSTTTKNGRQQKPHSQWPENDDQQLRSFHFFATPKVCTQSREKHRKLEALAQKS